jgi:short-subunit dehydrogenase
MALKVVITGASSGIGAALARHYASRGAQLGLIARRAEHLEQLAAALIPAPAVYALDVRDAPGMRDAAIDFISRFGVPDIVIANAGVSKGTLTEYENDLDVFQQLFDINVMGVVNTFHPFIKPMREKGAGTLAGIASVAGFRGIPGGGAYSASKAAAIKYCESLRVELRGAGVSVVTICPGYIKTPMSDVNRFKMPFIISVEDAAARIARAIDSRTSFTVIPWTMGIAARILRILPNWIYDRLFSRMPRKARHSG